MWRFVALVALVPMLFWASLSWATEDLPYKTASDAKSKAPYDYFCTGTDGERYELGEVVCLQASSCQPAWLAKCDMSLNNPMWRKVQNGCPTASLLERFDRLQPVYNPLTIGSSISYPKT